MEKATILTILVLGVMFCVPRVSEAEPMGTTFTYQGRLIDTNEAADGEYDFEFTLYDANTDGNQIGWAATIADVDVVDGYFTVELFLGSASFDGDARWLEIGVRPGEQSDPCEYTLLSPRQEVTPTPYAIYARMAGADNDWMVSDSNMHSIPPGNVGIGTTAPEEKLTVVDGTIKCTNSNDGGWAVQGEASGWYGQGVYGYGTGYGGRGVYGKAGEDFGMGVYGKAIAEGQVSNWGGYFEAAGDFGTGVFGTATATGDVQNYGGYFRAAGNQGMGIYAEATSDSMYTLNYGGYFVAAGPSGRGVMGRATNNNPSSNNYGGFFTAEGEQGKGVLGAATNVGNLINYGGFFEAHGEQGRGVYGYASHPANVTNYGGYFGASGGQGRGVYGYTWGGAGVGVYGEASGASGEGVEGKATGSYGIAVRGLATDNGDVMNFGGHFESYGEQGRGVHGVASSTANTKNFGGIFNAYGNTGRGVFSKTFGDNSVAVEAYGYSADFLASGPGEDYASSSSVRWKKDIEVIDNPLDKVMSLRGVYFNWDANHGGHHDVGMVAEEVGKVLPEIVSYEQNGVDAAGMDYSKLTPLLVEAIKELKAQNDSLKQRVEALERAEQRHEFLEMR